MSAHVPRRIFATPLVVTLAAACNSGAKSPDAVTLEPVASASATPSSTASATPSATGTPPMPERKWLVSKEGAVCTAAMDVDCGPDVDCNPPPPRTYACPPQITRYPATVVRKAGAKDCTTRVISDVPCPPKVACNPPPPHDETVPCP